MLILSVATRLARWASPEPELLGLGLNFYNPKKITTRLARTQLTRNPNRVDPKPGGLTRLTSAHNPFFKINLFSTLFIAHKLPTFLLKKYHPQSTILSLKTCFDHPHLLIHHKNLNFQYQP